MTSRKRQSPQAPLDLTKIDALGLLSTKTGESIPLVGVKATAEIVGRSAKVIVAQTYRNAEREAVEAVYRFPLPDGSAVCGFRAKVGARVVVGSVMDRDEAFKDYDNAIGRGDGAYLLDEERPNIFTMSVGNLPAGAEATVEVDYVEALVTHGADTRFMLPTTIGLRYTPPRQEDEDGMPVETKVAPAGGYEASVPYRLEIELTVRGRETIASVDSPSHPIRQRFDADSVVVTFTGDGVAMDRDFVLTVARTSEARSQAFAVSTQEGVFVQADVAVDLPKDETASAARVFVLDCSGSMSGGSYEQAAAALRAVLRGMKEGEPFNLVRFGSTVEPVFPSPVPFSEETLTKCEKALMQGANLGGTDVLPALMAACGNGGSAKMPLSVFFLTDGDVSNEEEVAAYLVSQRGRVRLFTMGVGHGPNEHFLRETSRASGGASDLVAPGERIEPKALRLFAKMRETGLSDLTVAIDGAKASVAPRHTAAFTGEVTSIFARLPAGTKLPKRLMVSGRIAGGKDNVEYVVPLTVVEAAGSALPALWARAEIRDIEAGVVEGSGSKQSWRRWKPADADGKAAEVSKAFGVICASTSFLAVEERDVDGKTTGTPLLRAVPSMMVAGWGDENTKYDLAGKDRMACRSYAVTESIVAFSGQMGVRELNFGPESYDNSDFDLDSLCDPTDLVMAILGGQRPGGGFDLDAGTQEFLKILPETIDEAVKGLANVGKANRLRLVLTALLLAILEDRFSAVEEMWKGIVEKSREWLAKNGANATVAGVPLAEWARKVV